MRGERNRERERETKRRREKERGKEGKRRYLPNERNYFARRT